MDSDTFPVYIVDDDPLVCRAVGRLVGAAGYQVQTFGSAMSFLARLEELAPGCVVLDLCLPDLDGAELHRQLQASGRDLPVIFLTGFGDIPTSVRAIKSGAVDFLQKPVGEDVLLQTIAAALAEGARTREVHRRTEDLARRLATLTPREREVMLLVLAGYLNKQVARQLKISEKTVKVHRAHLLAKMGTPRVAVLELYAAQRGLEKKSRKAFM
jgi:FixJ family two-component response regulator